MTKFEKRLIEKQGCISTGIFDEHSYYYNPKLEVQYEVNTKNKTVRTLDKYGYTINRQSIKS